MRVVFAGTPEVALPSLRALAASDHDLVGVVTRPDAPAGRGRRLVASPVAAAGRGARRAGAQARAPARPGLPGGAARAGARLLPGRRLRRAAAAVGARHPRARLGEPALLDPAGLARGRPGAARPVGRRRGHRRHDLPHRPGARRRTDVRRGDRAGPARRTPPATCWRGWPRPARRCWSPPSTASRAASVEARPQPEEGVSLAPKISVEEAEVRWTEPGLGRRPPDPRLHARARGLDHARRRAAQARSGPARPGGHAPRPGELVGRQERRARRHRHRTGAARRASRPSARSRWPPPTGRAACGSTRTPGSAPDGRPPVTPDPDDARRPRRGGSPRPAAPAASPARRRGRPGAVAALAVLRAVTEDDAYANLAARRDPARARASSGRDAAFATELVAGTLRRQGTYDAVLAACARPPASRDRRPGPRRAAAGRPPAARPRGCRRTPRSPPRSTWPGRGRRPEGDRLRQRGAAPGRRAGPRRPGCAGSRPTRRRDRHGFAVGRARPPALGRRGARGGAGGDRPADELDDLLAADNASPTVTLVARPGLCHPGGAARRRGRRGATRTSYSPVGRAAGRRRPRRDRRPSPRARAGVQDEGSQLVALALADAPVEGRGRALARPVRRARAARRRCWARSPRSVAPTCSAVERAAAPRRPRTPSRRGPARGHRDDRRGRRHGARPGRRAASTGCSSTRPCTGPGGAAPAARVPVAAHARGPRRARPAAAAPC